MAGEPILIAQNCAFIMASEPFSREVLSPGCNPEFSFVVSLANVIRAPILNLVRNEEFLLDDALRASIADMSRRSLILCGGLLEGAVTQIALSSVLDGYDVYVCADQLVTGDPGREETYLDRIRYCAGHIVTTRQIILELLSQEKDESARVALKALLDSLYLG